MTVRKIVEDDRPIALVRQVEARMRADIAGAADDKNRFTCHAPPLLFIER
jgi:hypothetical protein